MILCPNNDCSAENVDGTQFCEVCGEELPQPVAAHGSTEAEVVCPECGLSNPADHLACEACGADLHPGTATAVPPAVVLAPDPDPVPASASDTVLPLPAPSTATSTATSSADTTPGDLAPGLVKLVVEQGQTVGAQFVLGDPEMLVGREDEEEEIYPDIDLADQDAGYVHRRHASLRFDNGHLTVTHLGGANKTRLNNKPIPDEQAQNVKLGDKIAFGKVVVRVLPT